MALFVLGDTHLSLGASKPMDIFPGWNDYVERLEKNWRKLIKPEDTIVLAGDISWAMRLTDTRKDFEFLQSLPGQKIIMKGNHDYWWSTVNKMNAYLKAEGFDTLHILHNNSYSVEGYALCGTRGWLFDAGEAHDEKVMNREIGRLRMSLDAAEPGLEKLVFLLSLGGGTASLNEILLPENFKFAGQAVKDIPMPGDVILVCITRDAEFIIPHGNTTLLPWDRILCLTQDDTLHLLMDAWGLSGK